MKTYKKFGYADKAWNPLTGCTKNCPWCWARPFAHRLKGMGVPAYQQDDPFRPTFHPGRLAEPEKWRKPQVVACNFMGDWMDRWCEFKWCRRFLSVVVNNPQHTFLTLTKREEALNPFMYYWRREMERFLHSPDYTGPENLYNGLSITNQADADEKLPIFLQIPGKKWLNLELEGPIDLFPFLLGADCRHCFKKGYPLPNTDCIVCPKTETINPIFQVILGGMSGSKAKQHPMKLEWAEQIVSDCRAAGVPVFVKQLHLREATTLHPPRLKLSKDMSEWPVSLRVRQLAWGE